MSPIASLAGTGDLVLSPRPSHAVVPFALAEEIMTVREDVLLGFELAGLTYESGKLALGDGESAQVVQLRGTGAVLIELLDHLQSIDIQR